MIRADTLGPVRLTVDGAPPPPELLWRKHLALLLYLARSPRRTRSRDHLAGLLWADRTEAAARHSLNEALRVLRRSLPPNGLETAAEQIRLSEDAVELDVDRLARAIERNELESAARLVVGPFLEGFGLPAATEFEDWLAAERREWTARSVRLLVARSEQLLDQGAASEGLAMAERALRLAPGADPAIQACLAAMAVLGDRAGALARFEAYAARLEADLGVRPSSSVVRLVDRIRSQPARAGPVRPEPGQAPRRAPLVGRADELGRALEWWRGARGRSSLGMVRGDLGLGKSRLLEEVGVRARLEDGVVSAIRAVPSDRATPWSGAAGLARGLADAPGIAGAPPGAIQRFRDTIPGWAARFPGRADAALPPGAALTELVRAAADERPVLLAVDDADWLDDDSAQAIEAMLRDLATCPVLVIMTRTGHETNEVLDRLEVQAGRDVPGGVLRLAPLGPEGIAALARWTFPGYTATELERLVRRLATDSAGIPLLAAELAYAVAEGLDDTAGAAWPEPLKTLDDSMPTDLPDGIIAALRVGFRQLSPGGQSVLTAAALLPERFEPDQVAAAAELTRAAAEEALDELEWNRWLAAEPRGYSFVARIARDVVRKDMLTAGQRRRLEARIEALRAGGGSA
jgi:DNA-binding SARP family transcriptional activator